MKNPVFKREINTMFRSFRTFIAIGAYGLGMLGITALILFDVILDNSRFNGFDPKVTIELFCCMLALQTMVVFLAVPAFSASAISGERERQTFDLMLLTKMSTSDIIWGKLLSSLLFVFIMITAALPVYSVVFYYGGVSIPDLILVYFFDLTYAASIGSISIFFSSLFKRTVISTVLSYLTLVFYPIIITVLTLLIYAGDYNITDSSWLFKIIMSVNPIAACLSIIAYFSGTDIMMFLFGRGNAENGIKIWQMAIFFNIIISCFFAKLSASIIDPIGKNKYR